MSRHAVVADRDRLQSAAAREPQSYRQALRRQRFIRAERLSLAEAAQVPADFNPGPEYDAPAPQEHALDR